MTDFTGTWINQVGSVLELRVADGIVTGRFESGVGDEGKTLWVDVSGRALGDLITFNTVYERYRTVVAWIGQHANDDGTEMIKTLWIHATDVPDDHLQEWMWLSKRIGADVFRRT